MYVLQGIVVARFQGKVRQQQISGRESYLRPGIGLDHFIIAVMDCFLHGSLAFGETFLIDLLLLFPEGGVERISEARIEEQFVTYLKVISNIKSRVHPLLLWNA